MAQPFYQQAIPELSERRKALGPPRHRSGDPLQGVRRTLRTRDGLLTERQWTRIAAVFADDAR